MTYHQEMDYKNFQETISASKKKLLVKLAEVRMPKNWDCVLDTVLTNPTRLWRKHSQSWGILQRSFHRDGATCHTLKETLAFSHKSFDTRIISHLAAFPWPPHSPHLSVCDFFLRGYLKVRVYINKPHILAELWANIECKIRLITPALLKKVYEHFEKRLENCIEHNGEHLSDIVFRT